MKQTLKSRIVFLLFTICLATTVNAQHTKLPPFRMVQANNQLFRAEQLPFGRPIILIYFLPDCAHCQLLTENILKYVNDFKNTSCAMVTYYPTNEVSTFSRKYGLDKFSNFYVGTEGNSFFLKKYYNLSKLPFMALYTQNGDLVKTYYTEDGFTDLLQQLKKLKQ